MRTHRRSPADGDQASTNALPTLRHHLQRQPENLELGGLAMENLVASAISTRNGWVAACWDGQSLCRVSIGNPSPAVALQSLGMGTELCGPKSLLPAQRELLERLAAAAVGSRDDFRDVRLDLSHLGPFARRVVERCRKIPSGKTMTYGQLAAACGSPRAARAVGNTMRTNRFPLVVPCHRVVSSDGGLGGFSAPRGVRLKQEMLAGEQSVTGA